MAIKVYKPTTPGRRKASVVEWKDLTKTRPVKKLTKPIKKKGGRGAKGRIAVRHRGGGHKRQYRLIDFKMKRFDIPAEVISIEYDPNRSSRIALVQYEDGEKAYIVAPRGLEVGMKVLSSEGALKADVGNRMPLEHVPLGISVHNIELVPGQGGKIVRSAGQSALLMSVEGKWAHVKLPSGEIRLVSKVCRATVGSVSNRDHSLRRLGKAGKMRWLGKRPHVLGKAMNPVDHPHGGGEGHQPVGMKAGPKTKWGKKAMGVRTGKKGKASNALIVKRRKTRKRK